jgi:putative tryptophan/tyrosine transport system permease protein
MSLYAFLGAVESGLIFGFVALGSYVTFRVLRFPDITVEGSFPLGASVMAALVAGGMNPYAATMLGAAAGAAAGLVTAFLNVRLKILHILAGILTAIALYSVNLRIMGRPNTPLIGHATVFTPLASLPIPNSSAVPLSVAALLTICMIALNRSLHSEIGLALRAAGSNERMARANGIDVDASKMIGLATGNALVAFGGALFAQTQGAADVNMGVGTIVIGFAAVIGGAALIPARTVGWAILSAVVGSILYQVAMAIALNIDWLGLRASDVNLVAAVLVAAALVAPEIRAFRFALRK